MMMKLLNRILKSVLFGLKLVGVFAALGATITFFGGGLDAVGQYVEENWFRALVGAGVLSVAHFFAVLILVIKRIAK